MPKGNTKSPVIKSPNKRPKSRTKSPVVKSPILLQKKATRRRTVLKEESFRCSLFRLMKLIHPDLHISKRGMDVVNSMIVDLFEKLAREAGHLTRVNQRITLSSRDVEGAVKLVLPPEIGKYAIAAGQKALATYTNSCNVQQLIRVSQEH